MKFWEIFRYEFLYQLKSLWTWLVFVALVIISFMMTRDAMISEALHDDFFVNSPFAVAKTTVVSSLFWLLAAAAIAGQAAARDIATRMHPLSYTTPVTKLQYLGGRLLAAFTLNALLLLTIQFSIIAGIYFPGMETAAIGPFRPAAFITAYAYLSLPNAVTATVVQFALASRSGKPMTAYLGSVIIFAMSFVVATFFMFQGRKELSNVLDLIGMHFVLSDMSHMWTTYEKSWRLITMEGTILTNRLVWLWVSVALVIITYTQFRFAHRVESNWLRWIPRSSSKKKISETVAHTRVAVPHIERTFNAGMFVRQTVAITWASFKYITKSWAGIALLVLIPLLTIPVVIDQIELNGVRLLPTTAIVLKELTGQLSSEMMRWVIVPLLIAFFAGEVIWRERDAGLGEITDAMPGSEWSPLLGKFLGISMVIAAFVGLQMAAGIIAQTILNYNNYEIGLYLKAMFGLQLTEYLLFAILALSAHVIVDNKYIGHFVALACYMLIAIAPMFGIEHNLLIYSASPGWTYSDMQGFGAGLEPWLWFKAYWVAWAVLIAVCARLLWVRGKEKGVKVRLQIARYRFKGASRMIAAMAVISVLGLGGFIFYNTNILNEYVSMAGLNKRYAEYERRYGKYRDVPQPEIRNAKLEVDIYHEQKSVTIRGSYQLVNLTNVAIDTIHISPNRARIRGFSLSRSCETVLTDDDYRHWIFSLKQLLQPGDSMEATFEMTVAENGFHEGGLDASVTQLAAFFNIQNWLPAVGYQKSRELTSANSRRAHGLQPRPEIPSLYDPKATKERGPSIVLETIVSTDLGLTAVAPGLFQDLWVKGTRTYFHYLTSAPIGNEWPFFSSAYLSRDVKWTDPKDSSKTVAVKIYNYVKHHDHVESIAKSIEACLDYYSSQFGPYPYNHLTVVEHPGNGAGMHADPSMIIHEEGFALWNPRRDSVHVDLPYSVVGHEMGHQWGVPYAFVEGAAIMSESIAWYYGFKLTEYSRGADQLRKLRRFMRYEQPYAPIRRGEPVIRGLDPYLAYRRGPFALYTLSEYIGDQKVNEALRKLREKHGSRDGDPATTLDLYRELKAVTPDSLQYLPHDLFEVNTFWDLDVENAVAKKNETGKWDVTMELRVRKVVADDAGAETEVKMDELIPVGVYASDGTVIYLNLHRIQSGQKGITVTVDREPFIAGIDPNHLLDIVQGEEEDDNKAEIKIVP